MNSRCTVTVTRIPVNAPFVRASPRCGVGWRDQLFGEPVLRWALRARHRVSLRVAMTSIVPSRRSVS